MTTRIDRIFRSIEENAGDDISEVIRDKSGITDIKSIMSELQKTCEEDIIARTMKHCGRQCIPKSYITRAKTIYGESDSMDDFLEKLNETRIGGGQLHLKDGKLIGIYDKCYCGLINKVKGLSPLYCYCSAGWYEQLFSSVIDRPVEVEKIATIPDEVDHCEFEISFK